MLEIRIDAFKLLTQQKRPLPKKAQNIGILKMYSLLFFNQFIIFNQSRYLANYSELCFKTSNYYKRKT